MLPAARAMCLFLCLALGQGCMVRTRNKAHVVVVPKAGAPCPDQQWVRRRERAGEAATWGRKEELILWVMALVFLLCIFEIIKEECQVFPPQGLHEFVLNSPLDMRGAEFLQHSLCEAETPTGSTTIRESRISRINNNMPRTHCTESVALWDVSDEES
ncbi:hypothetical protein FKM82_021055 [Ascaphus truei]